MSRKSESSKKSFIVEIDEEGFTNKRCRNCRGRLSVEEVQVFVGKLDEDHYLCLNCYAK